jgi:hypothetical protein
MTGEIQDGVILPEVFGVDRDELADADAGVVHEGKDRVVAFLEIIRATAIHGGPEGVELVRFEPDARLNFGIYIIAH